MADRTHCRISTGSYSIPVDNIDTDQIIPARFLTTTNREGLGRFCFHDWRFDDDGVERAHHRFNGFSPARHQVLVVGHNFGCGSSREHAPWALLDMGIKAVISTRFADIFCNNAWNNGLPAITAPREFVDFLHAHPGHRVHIDITHSRLEVPDYGAFTFPCDPFASYCLIRGIDPLQFILGYMEEIQRYEASHRA